MSMRRVLLAAVSAACGVAFAGASQASVTYTFQRIMTGDTASVASFSYTAPDFLTADVTTVLVGDLDSCSSFVGTVCDDQVLRPHEFVPLGVFYDAVGFGFIRELTRRGAYYSYFVDGAMSAAGVYHSVVFTDEEDSILTVTDNGPGGGVPEPATWAVMLVGFAGVGATLRRRRPRAA